MSLQEYMAFMISRETENVQSAGDVEAAFRALTSGDKPFITATELYTVSTGDHRHLSGVLNVSNLISVSFVCRTSPRNRRTTASRA